MEKKPKLVIAWNKIDASAAAKRSGEIATLLDDEVEIIQCSLQEANAKSLIGAADALLILGDRENTRSREHPLIVQDLKMVAGLETPPPVIIADMPEGKYPIPHRLEGKCHVLSDSTENPLFNAVSEDIAEQALQLAQRHFTGKQHSHNGHKSPKRAVVVVSPNITSETHARRIRDAFSGQNMHVQLVKNITSNGHRTHGNGSHYDYASLDESDVSSLAKQGIDLVILDMSGKSSASMQAIEHSVAEVKKVRTFQDARTGILLTGISGSLLAKGSGGPSSFKVSMDHRGVKFTKHGAMELHKVEDLANESAHFLGLTASPSAHAHNGHKERRGGLSHRALDAQSPDRRSR